MKGLDVCLNRTIKKNFTQEQKDLMNDTRLVLPLPLEAQIARGHCYKDCNRKDKQAKRYCYYRSHCHFVALYEK
eukprot:g37206.t1